MAIETALRVVRFRLAPGILAHSRSRVFIFSGASSKTVDRLASVLEPETWNLEPLNRPRFQFSLRTLALGALLLGSAATLWWNWPAWRPVKTFVEGGSINAAGFTPDNRHFFSCTRITADGEKSASRACFNIRKTATGELVKSLSMPAGKYDFCGSRPIANTPGTSIPASNTAVNTAGRMSSGAPTPGSFCQRTPRHPAQPARQPRRRLHAFKERAGVLRLSLLHAALGTALGRVAQSELFPQRKIP